MHAAGLAPRWSLREEALVSAAALATNVAGLAALKRWLEQLPESERVARGAQHFPGLSVVFGSAEQLPWFDGVAYAGVDPRAPRLWLPTHLNPGIHPELLERAALRHAGIGAARVLLWPVPACVLVLR